MPPTEVTADRLFAKIGQLVVENDVLREQLAEQAAAQTSAPESEEPYTVAVEREPVAGRRGLSGARP